MSLRDRILSLYAAVQSWTYAEDWRTWLAHFTLTFLPSIAHPYAGAFVCGWYFRREQVQVANHGGQWYLDNYMDVLAPLVGMCAGVWVR